MPNTFSRQSKTLKRAAAHYSLMGDGGLGEQPRPSHISIMQGLWTRLGAEHEQNEVWGVCVCV